MDLAADVERLFQRPLAEFTNARNALASQLAKSGQKTESAHVKALPKPPVSAWVVNQLFWRVRPAFDRLLEAGSQFRDAQASGLAGQVVNVHEPLKAQREALNELSREASALLSADGHAPNPDTLRRVTMTLQALAALPLTPDGPQPGTLYADVDAPGFSALAALIPQTGQRPAHTATPSRVLAFTPGRPLAAGGTKAEIAAAREEAALERARAQEAAAKQAVKDGERAVAAARRDAIKAETAMVQAGARLKEAEEERAQAEAALTQASADADVARQAARRAASAAADAAQAVDDAARALAKARAQLIP